MAADGSGYPVVLSVIEPASIEAGPLEPVSIEPVSIDAASSDTALIGPLPIEPGLLARRPFESDTTPVQHPVHEPVLGAGQPLANEPARQAASQAVQVRLDGERLELEARDEIVLRCGRASITLRRNGRVVLRGAYVETSSEGVNRVKGAAVKIN